MRKILWIWIVFFRTLGMAQVTDTFDDGDFTNNPSWTGDSMAFGINPALQLQTLKSGKSDTVYLSTASKYNLNTVWEFYIEMRFDPSAANQLRVYLCSDREKLTGILNSYVLIIGESGSADSYDLYRQNGTTLSKIIDGPPKPRPYADTLRSFFRIIRHSNGDIELYSSNSRGGIFTLEGTAHDLNIKGSAYFGLSARYSATRSDKFIFDDLHIYPYEPDSTAPAIVQVNAKDPQTISVSFDKILDTTGLSNLLNYTLDDTLHPVVIHMSNLFPEELELRFGRQLAEGLHELKITSVADLHGNRTSDTLRKTFLYMPPYHPKYGDILINEIFADPAPSVGMPLCEYIELYNNTDRAISLANWTYSDGSSTYKFKNNWMDAKTYLLLCKASDTTSFSEISNVFGLSTWPSLNNNGDNLVLKDEQGIPIHKVSYHISWYQDKIKSQGGYSLEMIDQATNCEGLYNWIASVHPEGGTPGYRNSVHTQTEIPTLVNNYEVLNDTTICVSFSAIPDTASLFDTQNYTLMQGMSKTFLVILQTENFRTVKLFFKEKLSAGNKYELAINVRDCNGLPIDTVLSVIYPSNDDTSLIVINEIFADPSPEVGLPLKEFIELYNTSQDTVNLEGWIYKDPVSTYTFKKLKIAPEEHLILCAVADTGEYKKFGRVSGISPFPSINNAGDTLSLFNKAGRLIHQVSFTTAWYRDAVKKHGGWTLEMIDPYTNCDGIHNWTSSIDTTGGTPGRKNSVAKPRLDTLPLFIEKLTILNDRTITLSINRTGIVNVIPKESIYMFNSMQELYAVQLMKCDSPYYQNFQLTFDRDISEGEYIIIMNEIATCLSDTIRLKKQFHKAPVEKPAYGLLINELYPNPANSPGLPEAEFIELYNYTDSTVYLKGLKLTDRTSSITFRNDSIASFHYAIICAKRDSTEFAAYGNVICFSSVPSLNNTADDISLYDTLGQLIDQVCYRDNWFDKDKKGGGWTLERIATLSDCMGIENWRSSIDSTGGTPGRKNAAHLFFRDQSLRVTDLKVLNSKMIRIDFDNQPVNIHPSRFLIDHGIGIPTALLQDSTATLSYYLLLKDDLAEGNLYHISLHNLLSCSGIRLDTVIRFVIQTSVNKGELLINELLFNPYPDEVDFIEIYNNSYRTIDLRDIYVANKTEETTIKSIYPLSKFSLLLPPGKYVTFTENDEKICNRYYCADPSAVINIQKLPAMNDKSGWVVLSFLKLHTIDEFSYTEKMHFSLLSDVEGVSLERRSFSAPTQSADNWTSASSLCGYATPGYRNSQWREISGTGNRVTIEPKIFSPDNDGKDDALFIHFHLDDGTAAGSIQIFNSEGKKVKTLRHRELLGTDAMIVWDGTGDTGTLRSGIYIIQIEILHTNGKTEQLKYVCVLKNN